MKKMEIIVGKNKLKIVTLLIFTLILLVTANINNTNEVILIGQKQEVKLKALQENSLDEYYNEDYWEWYTRTTTNDQAYNGKHIIINSGNFIDFYGYGVTSYKDYLYKQYPNAGEKNFMFQVDETKADYHTLDGAGFIFNAKKENDILSGYVLLIREKEICIYRLNNVNAKQFETTANKVMESYAGAPIAKVNKTSSTIHNLIIKTSPKNVTVIDNEQEILNLPLDYSKHVGEDFGLISSYEQHNCSRLSKIRFSKFELELKDYIIPVLKTDEEGNAIENVEFQVKNEAGEVVRKGITNSEGIYNIQGLSEGIYTIEEIKAPAKYIAKNEKYKFKMTSDGKVLDVNTEKEILIKIINEKLKFIVKVLDIDNKQPIPSSKVNIYDENGKELLDSNKNPIAVTIGEDGSATITNIKPGTYIFKQSKSVGNYTLNNTQYKVTIKEDGTVIYEGDTEGIIYNKKEEKNQNNVNDNNIEDDNIATGKLPQTGDKQYLIILTILVAVVSIYLGIKIKNQRII